MGLITFPQTSQECTRNPLFALLFRLVVSTDPPNDISFKGGSWATEAMYLCGSSACLGSNFGSSTWSVEGWCFRLWLSNAFLLVNPAEKDLHEASAQRRGFVWEASCSSRLTKESKPSLWRAQSRKRQTKAVSRYTLLKLSKSLGKTPSGRASSVHLNRYCIIVW
jgi:hypothetical protein